MYVYIANILYCVWMLIYTVHGLNKRLKWSLNILPVYIWKIYNIKSLEEKIDSKFSEFSAMLRNIDDRIKLLESAKESCVSSSPSGSDSSSSSRKRKKRSPSDLQVCTMQPIRHVVKLV